MKEIREIPARKFSASGPSEANDRVLVEEPLEIYVNDRFYTLTMRLPGEEIPLAVGLCFTDGLIRSAGDFSMIRYCGEDTGNRIDLYRNEGAVQEGLLVRRGRQASYSSCGVCGSELAADACASIGRIEGSARFSAAKIVQCQKTIEEMQTAYKATGGTHAAGIFDRDGSLLSFSEDVGRHNALDKAIGKVLLSKGAGKASIIILTSRVSYEMALKAGRLGVEVLAGFSAVTSIAVDLASAINMTLIGFLRKGGGSIYAAPERIMFHF
jgi:FdhD protein